MVDSNGYPLLGVRSIAASNYHSSAIIYDGTVMSWGANYSGQLGDGTITSRSYALPVVDSLGITLQSVASITHGNDYTLALMQDGSLMAWGSNGNGQLGDGTYSSVSNPVSISGVTELRLLARAILIPLFY